MNTRLWKATGIDARGTVRHAHFHATHEQAVQAATVALKMRPGSPVRIQSVKR